MLAVSHKNPSKAKRKAKKTPTKNGMPTLTDAYNKADDLVELVYVDIANGVSRSNVIDKLQKGLYHNQPYKARQAAYYYDAALSRFAVDCDVEDKKLRDMFYGRYEAILEQCIKNGDMYNARATLDSMAKIFGIERKEPQTAIQINNNTDGISINFGFGTNQEEETNEMNEN